MPTARQLAEYNAMMDEADVLEADNCAALNGKLDKAFKLRSRARQYLKDCEGSPIPHGQEKNNGNMEHAGEAVQPQG